MTVAVAVSVFATVIPSFAEEPVDLLAASGYGDPEYLYENSVDLTCSEWLQHCNWQLYQGYMGFIWNGYPQEYCATREVVETTLSGGSEGYALHLINDTGYSCFMNTGIENLDIICGGFEEGKKYSIQIVAKIMEGPFDYTPSIQVNAYPAVNMTVDSQWHTYNYEFTYNSTDATADSYRDHANWDGYNGGEYKNTYAITLRINTAGLQYDGAEMFYESIKVYEVNNAPTGDTLFFFIGSFTVAIAATLVLFKKRAY